MDCVASLWSILLFTTGAAMAWKLPRILSKNLAGSLKRAHSIVDHAKRDARYSSLVVRNPATYSFEGIQMPLRATPELQRVRRSIYEGDYERDEIEAVKHLICANDIVLELGSGCGVVSAFIAQRLSTSSNLHTYEANPKLIASIESIASANGLKPNVTNAAVGLIDGEQEFFFDDEFVSSSFYDLGRQTSVKSKVKVIAIERLLKRIKPTFIFFDIEGAEQHILNVPMPDHVRALCGELHPNIIGDNAVSLIVESLIAQGFYLILDHCKGRTLAFVRPTKY
jgi:FkbM family methyltransferase